MRRIGSADSDGRCRKVTVSSAGSWISSSRCEYFSSSRTWGSAKFSRGERSSPRSSPTTASPALVSSRAMMLPVQPMPTMTASTSFNRVAMAPSSRKIGNRLRLDDVALAAVLVDQVAVGRRQAGKADHLPGDFVAVAAVDRIGKEALHGDGEQRIEELLAVEIGELRLSLLQRLERLFALLRGQSFEILAVGFARPGIGGDDAGGEKLARRERQLVAVFGLRLTERAAAIHLGAAAPGAGELPVDEDDAAALAARRRQLVGRDQGVDGRREESVFG